ncbi:snoRNA-binding rRNA-processing protein imp4 [Tulasnella sp. 403]|nr:snoRNA-binding rRNA-processing protein imp4 [Tulasnella sp. 403]
MPPTPNVPETLTPSRNRTASSLQTQMEGLLQRLHVVVVGPGLGREERTQSIGRLALETAKAQEKYVVIDADGLWLIQNEPHLIQGYKRAVLTPNVVEFKRLCDAMNVPKDSPPDQLASILANAFGNVTILQKGPSDIISNGTRTEVIDITGGLKRVGGQGDILSGVVGTFLAWGKNYEDQERKESNVGDIALQDIPLLASVGGSYITRTASRIAFGRLGRGVLTSDMVGEVGTAYSQIFGEKGEKGFIQKTFHPPTVPRQQPSVPAMSQEIRLSLPNGRIELVWPPPPEDDPDTHALYTHPSILAALPFWSASTTLEQISARRKKRTNDPANYRDFRIHHRFPSQASHLPHLLGTVGYISLSSENCAAEAGIIIAPEVHRGGYASEAMLLLLEYGFKSIEEGGLGMNRIQFTTAAMNGAMRGWLESALGATQEGTLREAWKSGEEYIDAIGYSILRREWYEGGAKERLERRVQIAIENNSLLDQNRSKQIYDDSAQYGRAIAGGDEEKYKLISNRGTHGLLQAHDCQISSHSTPQRSLVAMLRRQARERREYIYRKALESQEQQIYERKQLLKESLATGKRLPTELKKDAQKLAKDYAYDESQSVPRDHLDDEYQKAGILDPKILITTCRDPSSRLTQFAKELRFVFPNAHRLNRGRYDMDDLAGACRANEITDLIIVHEHRGQPNAMVVSHFPHGPTVYFTLNNVVLRHDTDAWGNSTVSEQYPHLIFDGFSSRLGNRVMAVLKFLFPVPKEDSKRVMTFANRSDFISFRHHVFVKTSHKEVQLAEVGPRFEMKPYEIRLGTVEAKTADREWVLSNFTRTAKKRRYL